MLAHYLGSKALGLQSHFFDAIVSLSRRRMQCYSIGSNGRWMTQTSEVYGGKLCVIDCYALSFPHTSDSHSPPNATPRTNAQNPTSSLKLLLWPELVGVAAFLLAAVGGSGWKTCLSKPWSGTSPQEEILPGGERGATYVAFPADHFLAVVLARKSFERRLDDTAAKTKNQM